MEWSIRHWEKLVYLSVEVAYKRKILLSQVLDVSITDKYILFMGVVNFHSKCKILGGVTEFFGKAFLCRFPPGNLPRPVVYSVHSLPIQVTGRVHIVV